ncbi:MAG TPA: queuosine salvage family protein [Thermomicrobiales bacterium]|nr:queuosine salvage family protein [Thermomicrobiales bacterium]
MLTYELPHADPLHVLESTRFVMAQAESVRIDQDALRRIAEELAGLMSSAPDWHDPRHYADGSWRTAGWVLVLDALNFCFWSEGPNPKRRWQVEWDGRVENGYWALAAALTRSVAEGHEPWDPTWLAGLTMRDVAHMLRPQMEGGREIPLLPLRIQNLHEVGRGLQAAYPNDPVPIVPLIKSANGSSAELIQTIVRRFPSFNDVTSYRGQAVHFYKRAQILIADLHGAFFGRGLGAFHDLDTLTTFADYKVPQVLRGFGALQYASELDTAIAARTLIPAGSPWEVEIRAATIWACEWLRQILAEGGAHHLATEVDWLLWFAGQSLPDTMSTYHRTLTVFY